MTRNDDRCGAPTRGGAPCRFPADQCPHDAHARTREGRPGRSRSSSPVGAIRERDLRALGWWLIEETLAGRVTPPEASAVNRMMHTLLQLGPTPEADELALQEVALRGLLMHGVPPRTEQEWRRAAEIFDDEALAEFRRWASVEEGAMAGEEREGP
ncbi:MAG: hypothetical protein OXH41_08665 [Chloroflexi bacterium]|nr:hypothetical protein [Chloroflexota bacterium]